MRSVNKVTLLGYVSRDPELKSLPSGQSVCSFGFATNHEWKNKEGVEQSAVEFHNMTAWGKLAESCSQHVSKGRALYIEGHLETNSWEGADKKKNFRMEVVIDELVFFDKKEDGEVGSEETAKVVGKKVIAKVA